MEDVSATPLSRRTLEHSASVSSHVQQATGTRPRQDRNPSSRTVLSGYQGSRTGTDGGSTVYRAVPQRRDAFGDWVDDEYLLENPWYRQSPSKPVFSLGKPLPRVVRRPRRARAGAGARRLRDDLAEAGELSTIPSRGSGEEKNDGAQDRTPRRTAAGTAHTDRRNDVGQPVFDYVPGEVDTEPERRQKEQGNESDHPNFKIDSEPLGKREYDEVEQGNQDPNNYRNWWARLRAKHPEPLAEFLATCVAIFMGLAGSLSVYLSANESTQYGTYETSCWAWGFAWMFGIYLGGGVSGAHMNPAISISLWFFRGFPWRQCMIYVLVQFLAAIVAGALAYGVFADTIYHVDPSMGKASQAFMSTPQAWVSPGTAFLNQCVGSAVMMMAIFALGDDQNNPPGAGMHALVLGLLVTTLKFTLGYNIGSALNPASDFGPRVIAYAVGYRQWHVFGSAWWIYGPWIATLVGSFAGCALYDGFIFVGSESPVNYRYSLGIESRKRKLFNLRNNS